MFIRSLDKISPDFAPSYFKSRLMESYINLLTKHSTILTIDMIFGTLQLVLLATKARLVNDLYKTLFISASALCILNIFRAVLSQGSDVYSALLMSMFSLLLTPAVTLVMVAFGAPVISVQKETIMCSLVLSFLILQPLLLLYGLDAKYWQLIASLKLPLNEIYLGSVGGLLGAWFGAIPIALDWDRDWQAYPITIVLGAYAGSGIGTLLGCTKAKTKIVINKPKKVKKQI